MSATDPMTIDERRKYLHKMCMRYWQIQKRKEKSRLISEMVAVTGLHRKSILRLIHGDLARKLRLRQRGPTYGTEVVDAVRMIARSLDYPCAERLQPNLGWMADQLIQHGELMLSPEVWEKLVQVSLSTVRWMVSPGVSQSQRIAYHRGPPVAAWHIPANIPMRRIPHQEPQPGHFEVDLVHRCGVNASGQYLHTLQMTDVTTGWCEPVATLGRSYLVMQDGFERIQQRLPFSILELHPDNGSEFLNDLMLRFWGQVIPQASLSRSRPYHKNDNRFVEENNYSLVRAYVGYQRLDTVAQTNLLNRLYDRLWLYHNLFQPVMRLADKLSIPDPSQRIKRIYDTPPTPFDRLCKTDALSPERKSQLQTLRDHTNPCSLRQEIQNLLDQLFVLPRATEGETEDVYLTLGLWKSGQKTTAHFSTGTTTAAESIIPTLKGEDCSVTLSFERTIPIQ